jgi:hypothetical protein
MFPPGVDCLDLIAGRRSALAVSLDRELTISWGAALWNLGVARRYFGHALDVDAFPEGSNPDLLAPIRLAAGGLLSNHRGGSEPSSDASIPAQSPSTRT